MTDRELMQQALDALNHVNVQDRVQIIAALHERLAQPNEFNPDQNNPPAIDTYSKGVMAERQRIVNLLMIQHEAAKEAHNYWHVAAQLIQADVASDT